MSTDDRVLDELRRHLNTWRSWANNADAGLDKTAFSCIRSTMDAVLDGRVGLALERWNDLSSPDRPELSDEARNWTMAPLLPRDIVLVEADRPENEDFSFQHADHVGEFIECDTCREKPGSPTLCQGCLHNREVIGELKRRQKCK